MILWELVLFDLANIFLRKQLTWQKWWVCFSSSQYQFAWVFLVCFFFLIWNQGWSGMGSYGHKHCRQVSATPWLGGQQSTEFIWERGKLWLTFGIATRVSSWNTLLLRSLLYSPCHKTQRMEQGKHPQTLGQATVLSLSIWVKARRSRSAFGGLSVI